MPELNPPAYDLAAHQSVEGRVNAERLLAMLQSYAPTGSTQNAVTTVYHEMLTEKNYNWKQVHIGLIGMIQDGLLYGNWPWQM